MADPERQDDLGDTPKPGPQEQRLRIDGDWEDAARQVIRKRVEPGTVGPSENPGSKPRKPKPE